MVSLPPDHAERRALADEVHARPPQPLETPSRATYVAVKFDADERGREHAHLARLCAHFGVSAPAQGATHFRADCGKLQLKWERHSEFSSYTFYAQGLSPRPFSEPPAALLPAGWLATLPGRTVVAAHARLIAAEAEPPDAETLAANFNGNIVVGAGVGGAGLAYTDYRIHEDGCSRFLVVNRSLMPRQAGRMLQRLFEIEAYRMMALLALPMARRQSARIAEIEVALARLTDDIAGGGSEDEPLLHSLTRLAAEVESGLAASQFRFNACRAYFELVTTRIAELREERLEGIQTIEEFMARRFTPAVATCNSTAMRMHQLSERVAQASALLSTRVDIARAQQNQALLASMDRRAKLQLRLQQTVEGLSVAAIAYYVIGLVAYMGKGLRSVGVPLDTDLVAGVAVPVVALAVLLAVRRARHGIGKAEAEH